MAEESGSDRDLGDSSRESSIVDCRAAVNRSLSLSETVKVLTLDVHELATDVRKVAAKYDRERNKRKEAVEQIRKLQKENEALVALVKVDKGQSSNLFGKSAEDGREEAGLCRESSRCETSIAVVRRGRFLHRSSSIHRSNSYDALLSESSVDCRNDDQSLPVRLHSFRQRSHKIEEEEGAVSAENDQKAMIPRCKKIQPYVKWTRQIVPDDLPEEPCSESLKLLNREYCNCGVQLTEEDSQCPCPRNNAKRNSYFFRKTVFHKSDPAAPLSFEIPTKNKILPSLSCIGRQGMPTVFDLIVQVNRLSAERIQRGESKDPLCHVSVWDGSNPPSAIGTDRLLRKLSTRADKIVMGCTVADTISLLTIDVRVANVRRMRPTNFVILRDVVIVRAYSVGTKEGSLSPVWMLQARDMQVITGPLDDAQELSVFVRLAKRLGTVMMRMVGGEEEETTEIGKEIGEDGEVREEIEENGEVREEIEENGEVREEIEEHGEVREEIEEHEENGEVREEIEENGEVREEIEENEENGEVRKEIEEEEEPSGVAVNEVEEDHGEGEGEVDGNEAEEEVEMSETVEHEEEEEEGEGSGEMEDEENVEAERIDNDEDEGYREIGTGEEVLEDGGSEERIEDVSAEDEGSNGEVENTEEMKMDRWWKFPSRDGSHEPLEMENRKRKRESMKKDHEPQNKRIRVNEVVGRLRKRRVQEDSDDEDCLSDTSDPNYATPTSTPASPLPASSPASTPDSNHESSHGPTPVSTSPSSPASSPASPAASTPDSTPDSNYVTPASTPDSTPASIPDSTSASTPTSSPTSTPASTPLSRMYTWMDEVAKLDFEGAWTREMSIEERTFSLTCRDGWICTKGIDLESLETNAERVDKFITGLAWRSLMPMAYMWLCWMKVCHREKTIMKKKDGRKRGGQCCEEGCDGELSLFVHIGVFHPLVTADVLHFLIDASHFRGGVHIDWAKWSTKSDSAKLKDFKEIYATINSTEFAVRRATVMWMDWRMMYVVKRDPAWITVDKVQPEEDSPVKKESCPEGDQ